MTHETELRALRYTALFAVLANVAFNYLSEAVFAFGDGMRVVTERYDNAFQPAPYAFAIWGVIYAGFIAYAIHALLPSQRDVRVHDAVSVPLIVANVLGSAWIVAFRYDFIAVSVAIMAFNVGVAVLLYLASRPGTALARVPFSLYLGWMCVAAIANVAIYLTSIGVDHIVLGETTWAALMLLTAGALGLVIAFRFADGIVPAVIAWASFAIWVDTHVSHATVGWFAIIVGMVTTTAAAYLLFTRMGRSPRFPDGRGLSGTAA